MALAPLQRVKKFHLEEFSHVDAWGLGEDVIILTKVKQEAELIFVCLFSASYVLVAICEAEKKDMIKRVKKLKSMSMFSWLSESNFFFKAVFEKKEQEAILELFNCLREAIKKNI